VRGIRSLEDPSVDWRTGAGVCDLAMLHVPSRKPSPAVEVNQPFHIQHRVVQRRGVVVSELRYRAEVPGSIPGLGGGVLLAFK